MNEFAKSIIFMLTFCGLIMLVHVFPIIFFILLAISVASLIAYVIGG